VLMDWMLFSGQLWASAVVVFAVIIAAITTSDE